jgi:hypothetical protein
MRGEPAVPTLDTVASRLATAPGRRKALMFISVGVALSLSASDACGGQLADVMKGVFRKAQRANVNVYGIDPAGLGGYQQYLRYRAARGAEPSVPGRRRVPRNARVLQDFMRVVADQTGGRAVINTNDIEGEIDRILAEDRVYYLIGYEPTSRAADGRFRRVEIEVNRPGASVRSRSGYWAPTAGDVVDRRFEGAPSAEDSTLSGLDRAQGVPLRVTAAPIALAGAGADPRAVAVAAVLSVRFPPVRVETTDTLTITRNVYDAEDRAGDPVRTVETVRLRPGGGDETRHDVLQEIVLEPGRHEVRYHVQSARLGASGTVYAEVDVPDLSRSVLAVSGLILSSAGAGPVVTRSGTFASLLPVVPTTARDFAVGETLTAYLRVHQAAAEPSPVAVTAEVFDAHDTRMFEVARAIEGAEFVAGGVPFQFDVPLTGLTPGPHLLSITARLPGGRTARRDVVFRVR